MMNRAYNLPRRYRNIRELFDRAFRGTSAERARAITCGSYVNLNMGFPVAKLYIKKYFDENARNQVRQTKNEMFSSNFLFSFSSHSKWFEIFDRPSFRCSKNQLGWTKLRSKKPLKKFRFLCQQTENEFISSSFSIRKKALAIDEKIGYPEYLGSNNATELENDYQEVSKKSLVFRTLILTKFWKRNAFLVASIDGEIIPNDKIVSSNEIQNIYSQHSFQYKFNDSYIHNVLKMLQIKAREHFRILREPIDRKAWGGSPPTVVNAFYTPSKNHISKTEIPLFDFIERKTSNWFSAFPAGILQTPFFDKDAPKWDELFLSTKIDGRFSLKVFKLRRHWRCDRPWNNARLRWQRPSIR